MQARISVAAIRALFLVCMLGACAMPANAQTVVESSVEARFQLDVHVPDSVLMTYLPSGWTPNIAVQGAAKDANLRDCIH